jgi:magnesium chelatase family protein
LTFIKAKPVLGLLVLTDTSIQESKDRIHSAIKNSGFNYPFNFRILVNLAPGNLHKEGTAYDLPMAAGIVLASLKKEFADNKILMIGELALDGSLRGVRGVLPIALFAKENGIETIILPAENKTEAELVKDLGIVVAKNLKEVIEFLLKTKHLETHFGKEAHFEEPSYELDMKDIKGQEFAKRALEIAAGGGHNVLFSGPPGSGKTLLAKTFASILPTLDTQEILEVTKIYSIAGLLKNGLIKNRPFRSPHHNTSETALIGGGQRPKPGEISLAHRGVLFLDEFPEFDRSALEALRQPLEDGIVNISRAKMSLEFPARFILVASQNPCPCGFFGDQSRSCECSAATLSRYKKKISGPILDRIDLRIEVPKLNFEKLSQTKESETSVSIKSRVEKVRAIQRQRFAEEKTKLNSEMTAAQIKKYCVLDSDSVKILSIAAEKFGLSARGYSRILKVARTIADFDGQNNISSNHIAEALQFRNG